jgi:transcriptional regulator with XRE-family HTH domain
VPQIVIRPNPELGEFLRSRRDRTDPAEVGLLTGRRRRVQGLRREELAVLAGVSADYYQHLEQGRHATASDSVLNALAGALRLNAADRRYLHRLTQTATPQPTDLPIRPETRRLIDGMDPTPALVLSSYLDVIATNSAARRLYTDFDALPPSERNAVRWMMTAPAARELHGDAWSAVAAEMIGLLRMNTGRRERNGLPLVDDLLATSDLFRQVWHDQLVAMCNESLTHFWHPQAGHLDVTVEVLMVANAPDQILVVLTPGPRSAGERAWHELMARPI